MTAVDQTDGGLGQPAEHAFAITVHDANDEDVVTRALYVGGTGDVKVATRGGEDVTFVAVPAGTILPIRVTRVWDTGTDASDMIGLY
jgi:hypothetical protein